jgi:S1-C subfamily serine protease
MKRTWLLAFLAFGLPGFAAASDAAGPCDGVVKIYTEHRSRDYQVPWSPGSPYSSTGSGVILDGSRILTNAHVVSDQTFLQVRRHGRAERHVARLLAVSHDADLAVLTVDDEGFFQDAPPLPLGELPAVREHVVVCGFPLGGDSLSATEGVVSRIEHQTYAHSGVGLLAVQIDAAVNPGNSGGPVIANGEVLGVVMQGYPNAANTAYFIPTSVIQHFLRDIEDGKLDGFPRVGFQWQPLESEGLRKLLRVSDRRGGVLVTRVIPLTPASEVLHPRDVLVAIDGAEIAPDGTVEIHPNLRSTLSYPIQQHQKGESLRIDLVRDGRAESVELVLDASGRDTDLVAPYRYDVSPPYFVYGGLVFNPVTENYLQSFGNQPPPQLSVLRSSFRNRPAEEVVVLNRVLASRANVGYQSWQDKIVTRVNGQRFLNLRALIALIEKASGPLLVLENDEGDTLVLDREQVEAEREDLLRTYGISSDRSME